MKSKHQLAAEMRQKTDAANALLNREGVTAEEQTQAESLLDEAEQLRTQLDSLNTVDGLKARAQAANSYLGTAVLPVPIHGGADLGHGGGHVTAPPSPPPGAALAALPAEALRSRVTSFSGATAEERSRKAYQFGMFFLASCRQNQRAQRYCQEHGIPLMLIQGDGPAINLAQSEVVNAQGGFLVPPQFDNDLIALREQHGVVRRIFRNKTMRSDTLSVPRRAGGLTAYFVTDNQAITESTKNWDRVTLTARKVGVLAKFSSELSEDAVIDIGNDLAGEIAYAFATLEDDCGLNGDGTSTYGGIVGVRSALLNLSSTRADIAGLVVAAGNLWSEIVLSDFNKVKGKLPKYADNGNTRWVVHKTFWAEVMERLMLAAGGITDAMIAAGAPMRFLGYPVEIAQKMPAVEANDQVCALLGDFTLGAMFGDRRQTTIAVSEHLNFAEDEIAIRGTQRFDINVHDVGNQSSTAASRVPGPIVGLLTAAS